MTDKSLKPDSEKKKKEIEEVELPKCTEPSDPEYSRAWNDDEPCDDGRAG